MRARMDAGAVAPRSDRVPTAPDAAHRSGPRALVGAGLLLAGAAGLRFFRIGSQSLWYDEGVSAGAIGRGPLAIVHGVAADFHPPLYYLLLAAWARAFGTSEPALRGLSACAGILLVLVTWRLATRLFGGRVGWLAGI
jgi:mannosyltransferase